MKVLSQIQRYGLAAISCGLALAVAWRFDAPTSCFFLAVMVTSLYGGKGPGLFAVALSSLAFDYFFLPPRFQFGLNTASFLRFGPFLVANLLVGKGCVRSSVAAEELAQENRGAGPKKPGVFERFAEVEPDRQLGVCGRSPGVNLLVGGDVPDRGSSPCRESAPYGGGRRAVVCAGGLGEGDGNVSGCAC